MERRTIFALHDGDVAQLARALDWQRKDVVLSIISKSEPYSLILL